MLTDLWRVLVSISLVCICWEQIKLRREVSKTLGVLDAAAEAFRESIEDQEVTGND